MIRPWPHEQQAAQLGETVADMFRNRDSQLFVDRPGKRTRKEHRLFTTRPHFVPLGPKDNRFAPSVKRIVFAPPTTAQIASEQVQSDREVRHSGGVEIFFLRARISLFSSCADHTGTMPAVVKMGQKPGKTATFRHRRFSARDPAGCHRGRNPANNVLWLGAGGR